MTESTGAEWVCSGAFLGSRFGSVRIDHPGARLPAGSNLLNWFDRNEEAQF